LDQTGVLECARDRAREARTVMERQGAAAQRQELEGVESSKSLHQRCTHYVAVQHEVGQTCAQEQGVDERRGVCCGSGVREDSTLGEVGQRQC
jgi:hypothetical protein